jgi:hypothetical protein
MEFCSEDTKRIHEHRASHAVFAVWYRVLPKVNDRWQGKHRGAPTTHVRALPQASGPGWKDPSHLCNISFATGFAIPFSRNGNDDITIPWMLRLNSSGGSVSHHRVDATGSVVCRRSPETHIGGRKITRRHCKIFSRDQLPLDITMYCKL